MVYDFPAPISPAVKTNHVGSVCEILASADESHRFDDNECHHWNLHFRKTWSWCMTFRLSFHRQQKRWGITYIAIAILVGDDGRVQHVAIVLDCGMLI